MTEEDRLEIETLMTRNLDPVWVEFTEQSARLSAVSFLIENMYADAYINKLTDFNARMAELLSLVWSASRKGGPMSDDEEQELQARIATHLNRFQSAVATRIEKRSAAR